jgi:hypothetical protein
MGERSKKKKKKKEEDDRLMNEVAAISQNSGLGQR